MKKIDVITSLCEKYKSCTRCADMATNRKNVVFGMGNINADLMIISDGPNADADEYCTPLAGVDWNILVDALLNAGVNIKDVYLTNMVLCRPVSIEQGKRGPYKKDREPLRSEIEACRERLYEEIYLVDPKMILLLGAKAAGLVTHLSMQNVLGSYEHIKIPGKTEKTVLSYPAVVTHHPSVVARYKGITADGSPPAQFREHVSLVAKVLRVANSYSQSL